MMPLVVDRIGSNGRIIEFRLRYRAFNCSLDCSKFSAGFLPLIRGLAAEPCESVHRGIQIDCLGSGQAGCVAAAGESPRYHAGWPYPADYDTTAPDLSASNLKTVQFTQMT